ncbi:MAG: DUF3343 domain-containing protein [Syntrophales bacterium]|nr:DUF3343 domain-containing protein [Syntrophales bacterium]
MTEQIIYSIALFDSTSAVLFAEGILKEAGVSFKIIPVPRHLSSDCGVCLRFSVTDKKRVEELLSPIVGGFEIVPL